MTDIALQNTPDIAPGDPIVIRLHATGAPASHPVKAQWVELLRAGTLRTRDGRGPYRLSDPKAVIARSFAQADGGTIPLDYNHAMNLAAPRGEASPAAGWIARMEVRRGSIWGLAEWTPSAAKAVAEREYRFISPVIAHHPKTGEVLAITGAGLTNNPNLELTALNAAQPGKRTDTMKTEILAELRTLLGLPDDADEDAVLAQLKISLNARSAPDPAAYVPMTMFATAMQELRAAKSGLSLHAAQLVVDHDFAERKLMPWMREWAIELCQTNKAAYDSFMEKMGPPVQHFMNSLLDPIRYRHERPLNHGERPPRAGDIDPEVLSRLGLSEDDVKAHGGSAR